MTLYSFWLPFGRSVHFFCFIFILIPKSGPKNGQNESNPCVGSNMPHHFSHHIPSDKARNEEMMMNDDNVKSSLLISSLLKMRSLYKFCYKLHISSWRSRWTELSSSYIYEVCCTSHECVEDLPLFILLVSITVYTEV